MTAATVSIAPAEIGDPRRGTDGTITVGADLMGGRVSVQLRATRPLAEANLGAASASEADRRAQRDAARTIRRIASWADRLTRFNEDSELSRLNADPAPSVPVGPTLAAVLATGLAAGQATNGIVDPTILGSRLAAEIPNADAPESVPAGRSWTIQPGGRRSVVTRSAGTRFDLGGVAKGWIADRAAAALLDYPAVVIDADGDLAIALAFGEEWQIGVTDPRTDGATLTTVELRGLDPAGRQRFGLATSGTSVHRWSHGGRTTHHLIDPRSGRPAATDVVQATVLAESATAAEAAAKTIVILGASRAEAMLDQPGVWACVVLTEGGQVLASPSALRWLA
jgi:thiamine biosynthesis lipoprotein